jgi:electron transfer flavoprotein beta subunit
VKIGVCIKQVPATDTRLKVADGKVALEDVKWEINPYDEFALERALVMKDEVATTEVVLITVGGADVDGKLREGLARGADRAIRLDDPAFQGSDSLGIARILAAAIRSEGFSLVLAGKQAVDGDEAQVPAMMAEVLGWAQVTVVDKLDITGEAFKAWRRASGGTREIVEGKLPAVVSAEKGLVEKVRYSSLKGIMLAKKKEIAVKNAAALGLDTATVGAKAAIVSNSAYSLPPARPSGRVLEGDSATRVKELVRLLREEAKVI